jgi:osmotically-inducible protein OsmY
MTRSNRSDTEIFAQARKALDERPTIPATVRVHVENGVAWLTGVARRLSERAEAERVVRDIDGVREVVNKVSVTDEPRIDDIDAAME